MSRVLTVKRGGGRGWPLLIALLVAIALLHETLARALGGPAERLQRLLGKTSAWNLGACLCGATQEVTVVRDGDIVKSCGSEKHGQAAFFRLSFSSRRSI